MAPRARRELPLARRNRDAHAARAPSDGFSTDGRTLTSAEGPHRGGVTVVPLDRERPIWSAGEKATSAIAFGDARLAYLSDSGWLVFEERATKKPVWSISTSAPTTGGLDLGFVKFGGSTHFYGALYFDPARDRVIGIGR